MAVGQSQKAAADQLSAPLQLTPVDNTGKSIDLISSAQHSVMEYSPPPKSIEEDLILCDSFVKVFRDFSVESTLE